MEDIFLREMLRFDATKSITVDKALESPYFDDVRDEAIEAKHDCVEQFEFEGVG